MVKIAILSTTNASPTLAGIMDSVWIRKMDGSVTVEWDILERIVLSRQEHLLLHLDSHGSTTRTDLLLLESNFKFKSGICHDFI